MKIIPLHLVDDDLDTNYHGIITSKLNAEELVSEDLKKQIKKVILEDKIFSEKNNSVAILCCNSVTIQLDCNSSTVFPHTIELYSSWIAIQL